LHSALAGEGAVGPHLVDPTPPVLSEDMMILRLLILIGLFATLPDPRAAAQVSPDDARRALEVLQDPQKREQLVTTLQTIAKAGPPTATAATAPAPAGAT